LIFFEDASIPLEAILLGVNIAAAVIILFGFWLYNRSTHGISAGTWFILASGEFLDFGSYWDMVGGDFLELFTALRLGTSLSEVSVGEEWIKSMVPAAFALGTIGTFLLALLRRRFSWPDANDWFIIFIDALITVYWISSGAAVTTNLLFQGTTIMAFIPMYRALHSGKEVETFWPWMLWTTAYVGFLFTAFMSFGDQPAEIAYPTVGVITHAIVIMYVLRGSKKVEARP